MKQALVIKMYGDSETAKTLADGIISIEPLDADEMEVLQQELKQLRAERDMRNRCNRKYYESMVEVLNAKYPVKRTHPFIGTLTVIAVIPYLLFIALKEKIKVFVRGPWL